MEKKYKLVEPDEDVSFPMYNEAGMLIGRHSTKAYQIMAIRDITPNIPAGSLGGYVEGEHNLSHEGNCWIYRNGYVYQNARIEGNTNVIEAYVMGNATIKMNNGNISNSTVIKDDVVIDTNGSSLVVIFHCIMRNKASIRGIAGGVVTIDGCRIYDNASIVVTGDSQSMYGATLFALVYKGICFGGNMKIIGNKGYMHIEPLIGGEHGNMALTITPDEFIYVNKFGAAVVDNQSKAYMTNKYRELIHAIQVQLSLEAAHV